MSRQASEADGPSWGGMDGFDKLLEHRVRLAICVILARNDAVNFQRLKTLLAETDGSLGAHLKKLEASSYLRVRKQFQDRKPISWYRLTKQGRMALETHLKALESLIRQGTPEGAKPGA
ncbi:MAG: winged helix-turn-helix domain-containing protein [Candidatus Krumholzibacteriia bacterium]